MDGNVAVHYLSDCNWNWTHNHLVCKRTLNHLAQLAKWLSVRLQTKWLWVWVQLQSLKLPILPLLRARSYYSWHSGNYRVWIHSETRTWHDKNIQFILYCIFVDKNCGIIFLGVQVDFVFGLKKSFVLDLFFTKYPICASSFIRWVKAWKSFWKCCFL